MRGMYWYLLIAVAAVGYICYVHWAEDDLAGLLRPHMGVLFAFLIAYVVTRGLQRCVWRPGEHRYAALLGDPRVGGIVLLVCLGLGLWEIGAWPMVLAVMGPVVGGVLVGGAVLHGAWVWARRRRRPCSGEEHADAARPSSGDTPLNS